MQGCSVSIVHAITDDGVTRRSVGILQKQRSKSASELKGSFVTSSPSTISAVITKSAVAHGSPRMMQESRRPAILSLQCKKMVSPFSHSRKTLSRHSIRMHETCIRDITSQIMANSTLHDTSVDLR